MKSNGFKKSVVVMGGGTGIYPVVSALKNLPVKVTTIIAVSDSGGSTGRIRDEFGFPPVGDLRQSLAALADTKSQEWIQKLLLYRFEKGNGLSGHNLGNLILTALQDMTGSTTEALNIARNVFRISGSVIPVTESSVQLEIHYTDGSIAIGEHILDEQTENPKTIASVRLTPDCVLNPAAAKALVEADHIIIGPGDFYASLLAVLTASGLKDAFKKTKAEITYILNLMTRHTQTKDMSALDHIIKIEEAIGRKLSHVLQNSEPVTSAMLSQYAEQHEYVVADDTKSDDKRIIKASLLEKRKIDQSEADAVHRSLLRHDGEKLLPVLEKLLDL